MIKDFEIQIDHPIPDRRPDQALINKTKIISYRVEFKLQLTCENEINRNYRQIP